MRSQKHGSKLCITSRKIAACVFLFLTPIDGCAQGNDLKTNNAVQTQINLLVAKLDHGEIGKIEILQIPSRILTRTRVSPEMLERQFHYKLTIRDIRGESQLRALNEAMKSVVVEPETEEPDLRWGLIFYGLDDSRVGALYFDKAGRRGNMDNTPVHFQGDIFEWLNSNFSGCFR
jgi:hypothetical protein